MVSLAVSRIAFKVATAPGRPIKQYGDTSDLCSCAEPPSETDDVTSQAYQVPILRDSYRLLTDTPRSGLTSVEINLREFDSVAEEIDWVEVSVSLHTLPTCAHAEILRCTCGFIHVICIIL